MSNPVSALTALALAADQFESISQRLPSGAFGFNDPVINELSGMTYLQTNQDALATARAELEKDADLTPILDAPGEENPMFSSPLVGGSRQGFDGVMTSLLSSANKQLYVQGIARTESSFTRAVLENYDELKRALRGERIRVYVVRGIAGIKLDPSQKISTPWGTIRGVDTHDTHPVAFPGHSGPKTTALLVSPLLVPISITRAPDSPPLPPDSKDLEEFVRVQILTPLVFALASSQHDNPMAPILTFQTTIPPFFDNAGYSAPLSPNPFIPTSTITSSDSKRIEDLARTLYDNYHDSLQIASIRVVSAISQRLDKSDALIDAVTAWENLVGTRNETAYRVTAALTLLLEPDRDKRITLRKQLTEIYEVRSRVVHGATVDGEDIAKASETAIHIALTAMLELYKRGGDWLSMKSSQRSERLILGQ
jgi:hypothetical protein